MVRYREIFFGMLNLALSMVFYSVLEKFYALTHGADGIRLPPVTFLGRPLAGESGEWTVLGLALVLALACGALVRVALASPLGEALAGIKTRETRLDFMGVSPKRVLLAAYVASAVMAGFAGAIIALTTGTSPRRSATGPPRASSSSSRSSAGPAACSGRSSGRRPTS